MNKYELVIFDMDGTILNTLEDLRDSLNYALKKSNYPERSLDEVRSFVGNGIRKLINRGVPKGTDSVSADKVYNDFMEYYKEHSADKTKEYDGISELIIALRNNGYKTAVVSNKADDAVQQLCFKYFKGLFNIAVGERHDINKKPAPDAVNEVLSKLEVLKEKTVYIGDSEVDIQTAQNAGIDHISVDWGFRDRDFLKENGAGIIVSSPLQLLKRFTQ